MALPTIAELKTMGWSYLGQPFVEGPTKSTIDLTRLGFSYLGQPFVGNPANYSYIETGLSSLWISTLSESDLASNFDLGKSSTWVSTIYKSDSLVLREIVTSTWVSVLTLSDIMSMLEGRSDTWVWVITQGDSIVVLTDWYNLIESQIITTLISDSWLGTAGTTVKTREAKLRGDYRSYFDSELPAIIAKINGKRQVHSSTGDFQKFFRFTLYVLDRNGDLDVAINNVQEITSVLEDTMEKQYSPENDLSGLGTYSLVVGGPITRLNRTRIAFRNVGKDISAYEALAQVDGEIEIVTT